MNLPDNCIRMLGAYGSKYKNLHTTCLQITDTLLIDAGNIMEPLQEKAEYIKHIFLTHSHFDHISDLPFLIDTFFEKRGVPLNIYATEQTINNLKKHLFNNNLWPDFTEINLLNQKKSLKLHILEYNKILNIENIKLKPIKNNHIPGSCGFVVTKGIYTFLLTSDTYMCDSIIDEINTNSSIKSLIIEVSFPSEYEQLAKTSGHLTPKLLKELLSKINRNINVYINHLKPLYTKKICDEIAFFKINASVLKDNDLIFLKGKNE